MTYAYRRTTDLLGRRTVDLFASERGSEPPNGYVACSWPRFVRAWRVRDALMVSAVRARWAAGRNTTRVAHG